MRRLQDAFWEQLGKTQQALHCREVSIHLQAGTVTALPTHQVSGSAFVLVPLSFLWAKLRKHRQKPRGQREAAAA